MDYKYIICEKEGNVFYLTLNSPPLNILNIAMMEEMNSALENILADKELSVLVIRSNGKAFSAGVDVGDHTADRVGEMIEQFHGIFRRLDKFEGVTIAAVGGAALGGGCELAIFCDVIIASDRAKFGQPEIQVGVYPPIAILHLQNRCPQKFVYDFLLSGVTVKAEDAWKVGLISRMVSDEAFAEELEKYVEGFSKSSGIILKLTKKALRKSCGQGFEDALKTVEDIYLSELMRTHDANEGLAAFLEKRRPSWKNC